ncbi:MAG: decaprenyl-phosphate phosphoribosyltransferase [bacterium]
MARVLRQYRRAESIGEAKAKDGVFVGLLKSLRPKQWTKNLLVFAGLVFSGQALNSDYWPLVLGVFAAFCLLAGAIYLYNDVLDREKDKLHPKKNLRPIAAGIVAPGLALVVAAILAGFGLVLAFIAGHAVGYLGLGYLALNLAYSAKLKAVPLIDLFVVATGFVFRAVAGVAAVEAELSPWFLLCTVLLSFLLILGKRRHELMLLDQEAGNHRAVLGLYSRLFLDQMISVITTATLISYFLYTFFSEAAKLHQHDLMWTIPPVLYGMFRYLYLIYEEGKGGEPEELLLQDWGILGSVLVWGISVVVILYLL